MNSLAIKSTPLPELTDRSKVPWTMNIGCCCVIIHTGVSALWRGQQHIWIQRKKRRQHSRPLSSALSIPLLFPILACNAFYNPHFFAGLSTYSAFCIAGFFKHMDSFVLTLLLHSTPLRFSFQNLWQLCFQNRKTVSSRNRKQSAAAILQLLKGLARHRFLGTGSLSAQKIGRGGQS